MAELMFIDFMGVCFDQIFNQAPSSAICSAARRFPGGHSTLGRRVRAARSLQSLLPVSPTYPG